MKFTQLESQMRFYETALDQFVPPDMFIVARMDGRGFTRLTKEKLDLKKPFDVRFRDAMAAAVMHLMQGGFNITYGYVQSDEISLLFHRDDQSFNRKHRKLLSILAGEASAAFTYSIGHMGAFDCRLCLLPDEDKVADYFSWRAEDAHRNSLSAWCYWKLRESGKSAGEATKGVEGLSVGEKNQLLFDLGINYNDLPAWQKRGIGFYWNQSIQRGFNPEKQEETSVVRRVLKQENELPLGGYREMIVELIRSSLEEKKSAGEPLELL